MSIAVTLLEYLRKVKEAYAFCFALTLQTLSQKILKKNLETFLSYFSDTHFFLSYCLAGYVT